LLWGFQNITSSAVTETGEIPLVSDGMLIMRHKEWEFYEISPTVAIQFIPQWLFQMSKAKEQWVEEVISHTTNSIYFFYFSFILGRPIENKFSFTMATWPR